MQKETEEIIKGKTENGFPFSIPKNKFYDQRLIDEIAEMEDGNLLQYSKVIKTLFDKDQKEKLYKFCSREDGTVSPDKVAEELNNIFKAIGEQDKEVKNS